MATKTEYIFSGITEVVIGCAMKVHRTLGKGFPGNIYQRALSIELNRSNLKATSVFDPSHLNQVINYLHAFNMPVGLLLNFGKDSLEFKRFTNNQYKTNII